MYAVVTGASRGIGKAIARAFGQQGYNLLLTSQNRDKLLQTVEELKTAYPDITIDAQALDIGFKEKAVLFAEWVASRADTIDVLVNNAGTFLPGNVSDEEEGTLEKIMAVNVYSAYHLTRGLLPKMKAQKRGHIFNICSIAGLQAYPNGGSYSISKAALHSFSKNLRFELMSFGIKVTAVIPGAVYTDSWAPFVEKERIMEVEDIAQMVLAASRLSPQAVVEDIVLRPQLGDL